MIGRRECGGLGAACLLDRGAGRVARADPRWFAKGVAAVHVAINYINLYRSKVFYGADPITGYDILLSLDMIYYAYDLLTDFKNDGFTLMHKTNWRDQEKMTMKVARTHSIPKPAYKAEVCVFENGWGSVASLGLLEHFARSALRLASLRRLERAPEQARLLLLLLALAYCSPRCLPPCLLTHVMLDVILQRFPFDRKQIHHDSDNNGVTDTDCGITAATIKSSNSDMKRIMDRKLQHALAEFQQCLLQLSALNALCGAERRALVFARTYNGTLVLNLLRAAEPATNWITFMDELLSPPEVPSAIPAYSVALYPVLQSLFYNVIVVLYIMVFLRANMAYDRTIWRRTTCGRDPQQ